VREFRLHGSVRGAPSNGRPYREQHQDSPIASTGNRDHRKMVLFGVTYRNGAQAISRRHRRLGAAAAV
jgi:hypothetical protein